MYLVKDLAVLNLDPILINLTEWVSNECGLYLITSAYRPNDPRTHGTMPVRAIDFRLRASEVGPTIEKYINAHWEYDYLRPTMRCAIFHDTGRGPHLHLQSHPNTRRR